MGTYVLHEHTFPCQVIRLIRLEEAPDGYRAMDERESIKVLIEL
jgi:threonine dehydrogenase-like Zn-dependent dehydrogenase